jgi:hypothetical protein
LVTDEGFGQMSYDDIATMAEYTAGHRTSNGQFDFVVGYNDAEDRSVTDLEGLGATWMFFNFYDAGAETMAKVRSGPWR